MVLDELLENGEGVFLEHRESCHLAAALHEGVGDLDVLRQVHPQSHQVFVVLGKDLGR